MTKNARFKNTVREYAANHGMTYQQSHQTLTTAGRTTRANASPHTVSYPLGRVVHLDGYDPDYATPLIGDLFTFPRPHSIPNILISCDDGAPRFVSNSLIASISAAPGMEDAPVVIVAPHHTERLAPENQWLLGKEQVQFAAIGNYDAGYSESDRVADLINEQPSPAVFYFELSHPYPPVTQETIRKFEQLVKGTPNESIVRPPKLREKPMWEDSDLNPVFLTDSEVESYDRLLAAIARRLHESRSRGDVIIVGTSSDDTLRAPLDRSLFGLELFTGIRAEYEHPLVIDDTASSALPGIAERLPSYFSAPFWAGMSPKDSRLVLANELGAPASDRNPKVVLIKDPPITPHYWHLTYEEICARQGISQDNTPD